MRVAAAALRWPSFCACCGKRANSLQRLSHTLTTESDGVIREKHSWEVPYCLHCVEHVKFQSQANVLLKGAAEGLKRATKKLESAARKEGRASGRSIRVAIVWGLLTFLLGMGLFNPLVLKLLFARESELGSLITPWVTISLIFLVVGLLLGGFLWYMGRLKEMEQGERQTDRAERNVEAAEDDYQRAAVFAQNTQMQAQSFLQPGCTNADFAVHYVGWEGYTHVFYFDNEAYAVAFVTMNRGNVVDPAMM